MTVTHYQNPIIRGMRPDPSIVLVDGTYYMVHSTFEYYPGIALSKSQDLLNWQALPSIAQETSQADLRAAKSNEGIFAVCIRYHEGQFYVITTNFAEFKNFIIRGSFNEDKTAIIWEKSRTEIDIFGIDPDLFFEDGRCYIQFTGYLKSGQKAIQQVEINLDSGDILRGPEVLTYGTGGRDVEGPHILREKGCYYLLAAEGGTGMGHMITMFRGEHLWGPFEPAPANPLFSNRDRAEQPLQNIGHGDLFQDTAGNWWLTCLGTRPATIDHIQITNLGRETLLYPVDWTGHWPVIYKGIPTLEVDLTDFPEHAAALQNPQAIPSFVDLFDESMLHPEWLSLRDRLGDRLSLASERLTLIGSDTALHDLATPSFLGLRQTEQEETLTVTLDPEHCDLTGGAFGIAVLINSDHYACLMIEQSGSHYQIRKYIRVLDLEISDIIGELSQLPETLTLTHTASEKRFTAQAGENTVSFTTQAQHFSNEAIAALNTGDMQGLYALGNAKMAVAKVERR